MPHRRLTRRLMQLCCIFLLLFSQQTALTHALWHAAGGDESHAAHAHDADGDAHHHDADAEAALCAYHLAFGTLLGGHHGAATALALADAACAHAVAHPIGRIAAESVPAVSRGPPLLL